MSLPQLSTDRTARVGLLAGWGDYPRLVAAALQAEGAEVVAIGVRGHVSAGLQDYCHSYREIGIARLGAAIRFWRRHGVSSAIMAGKIHKLALFRRGSWLQHLPDWETLRTFAPHWITRTEDRRDDTLVHALIGSFERHGIHFRPATDFLPELLVTPGPIVGRLSAAQKQDVDFAWQHAKQLGALDVGQTVVVKGRAVLALEAIEGTDQCIKRAGELCPQGGFTVVKVAKPQQDMRFDVPTIGLGTMQTIADAGGAVLAVEAGRTIVIDQPALEKFGRRHKVKVFGHLDADQKAQTRAA
jgi:hypothetical protein